MFRMIYRKLMDQFASDYLAALWDVHHPYRDFGESGEKVLRRLSFVGGGNVEVAVRSIRGEKRAILSLKPSAVFEFALKGKEFEMEFHLGKGAFVESLEAEYDLLGGEE